MALCLALLLIAPWVGTPVFADEERPAFADEEISAFVEGDEGDEGSEEGIFAAGSGAANDPYTISTAAQLGAFRDSVNGGASYAGEHIKLGDNISISGSQWTPIGTDVSGKTIATAITTTFDGAFDGGGKVISGLTIGAVEAPAESCVAGFFGVLGATATVKNLGLTDVNIYTASSLYSRAGGLAAYSVSGTANDGGVSIDNCYVTGIMLSSKTTASAISAAGGLVGTSGSDTAITNCWTDITVKSETTNTNATYAAGLIASNGNRNIVVNCYTLGDVVAVSASANASTGAYVGGVIGMPVGKDYNLYAAGNLTVSSASASQIQYTAVGAVSGYVISTATNLMDTIFYNTNATVTVGGESRDVVACGTGSPTASKAPTNATGYTAVQIASETLASALNQGVKNMPEEILLPVGVELFGWELSGGVVALTGAPYEDAAVDEHIFASGDGTEASPYLIATEAQLRAFAISLAPTLDYAGNFIKLANDIELSAEEWTPVGEGEYAFAGTFDGGGYTVSGLKYTSDGGVNGKNASETAYVGFVGVLTGTVKNLGLTDIDIQAVGSVSVYAGAIAGLTYQATALIDGCYATGKVYCETLGSANNFAGGITGSILYGSVVNTWSDVKVSSVQGGGHWAEVGGITATNNRGYVLNCYTLGNVYASASRELEAGIAASNLVGMQAGVMINSYAVGGLETTSWAQNVGAVSGNTTGIGIGYFLYYNNEAAQNIGGQSPNPAIGVGVTVKTIDDEDGVTVRSGFNYELNDRTADFMQTPDFADELNANFAQFPIALPDGITLKRWAIADGVVTFAEANADITVKEVVLYDESPSEFQAGEYSGRNAEETVTVRIAVTDDALTSVTLVSPAAIEGSVELINEIIKNPKTIGLINGLSQELKELRDAVATALEKAKTGDTTGYGAADPATIFAGGAGTEANPYQISTPEQLRAFAAAINEDESFAGIHIALTGDITLSGSWIPAGGGNGVHPFSGVLNGGGYTIDGINIGAADAPASYRFPALIGYANTAAIRNLNLTNVSINNVYAGNERAFAGTLVGGVDGMSYIDHCSASGSVTSLTTGTGACFIGGLVGLTSGYGNVETLDPSDSYSSFITNSYTDVALNGTSYNGWAYAGGIVGNTNRTYVLNCYTLGGITVRSGKPDLDNLNRTAAGGISGFSSGYIANVYTLGNYISSTVTTDVGGYTGRHTGTASAEMVYYNTDAEHYSGPTKLDPVPGYGYLVASGNALDLAGKSAAELKSQAFADLLNDNLKKIDVSLLDGIVTLGEWTYDSAAGIVTLVKEDDFNLADPNNPFLGLWKATAGDGSGNWVSVEFNADGTCITTLVQDGTDPLVLPSTYTYHGGDTLVMNGEDTITLRADRISFDALLGGVVPTVFYKVDTSDTFNLVDLSNPFIGQWQSDIPSVGATLIFDYKADGAFDYEMVGVPAEYGGAGSGGYVVFGGVMISYLDFEGAAVYTFEVVDNDTINVTELEPEESGELVPGNTAPFTRVKGSDVNTKDAPFVLSNPFIGKWESVLPDDGATIMEYQANGIFSYNMVDVPEEQGGKGSGCYIVYGDKQVLYYADFAMIEVFSFELVSADLINVTALEANENGELIPGNTALFTRVRDENSNPADEEKDKSTNTGNDNNGNDSSAFTTGGVSTNPPAPTVSAADGTVLVDFTLSGGNVTLTLPDSIIAEIIAKSENTAILDVSEVSEATGATLPADALDQLADAGLTVEIRLPGGTITFSREAAASIEQQAGGANMTIEIKQVSATELNASQREAVGNASVFDISIKSGNSYITNFNGGLVAIALPYTLKSGGDTDAADEADNVIVWYLDSEGNLEPIPCVYDQESETVNFSTSHLSLYAIGIQASAGGGDSGDFDENGNVEIIEPGGIVPGGAMGPDDGRDELIGASGGDGSGDDLTLLDGGVPLEELPKTGGTPFPLWIWLGSGVWLLFAAGRKITARRA
jgi:hypothetical protein